MLFNYILIAELIGDFKTSVNIQGEVVFKKKNKHQTYLYAI